MRRACVLAAAALLALSIAGCGSDDASSGSSGSGGTTADGGAGQAGAGGGTAGTGGSSGNGGQSGGGSGGGSGGAGATGGAGGAPAGDVTVHPTGIDDVLTNPGMGFADFHFGWWCNLPPTTFSPQECADRVRDNWPENYPVAGTAYFRWHWRDLEPVRGQVDFEMIDRALQSANALAETLGFRVMVIDEGGTGLPQWLLDPPYGVEGRWLDGVTFWPDVRDPVFQQEHQRFLQALGDRYDGHPALDHVDIGTAGCWGEWNTACIAEAEDMFEVYEPQDALDLQAIRTGYELLVDHHLAAFSHTPVVMLGIGSGGGPELDVLLHATAGGAGWRVDCWGDWGIWGGAWSHHDNLYPDLLANAAAADPSFADVWKHAPVQLEVCGTMPDWYDLGWSADPPDGEVYRTFQWALEQHASVLNAKSAPVPASYVDAVHDLLRRNGYRLAVEAFNHPSSVEAGGTLSFVTTWTNGGVAPPYLERTVAFRLRGVSGDVRLESAADIRTWTPGTHETVDTFTLPEDLEPGTYRIEVAVLDRDGTQPSTTALPPLQLAFEGRGADGWYELSELEVE